MDLKEVVNLRKLGEEFYFCKDKDCPDCPFYRVCSSKYKSEFCPVGRMLGVDAEFKDMYDLEREGNLKEGFNFDV